MKEEFPSPSDSVASYTENESVDCIKTEESSFNYGTSLPLSAHHYSHYRGGNVSPITSEYHNSPIKVPYLHQQTYGSQISFSTNNKLCYQTSKLCVDEEERPYDDQVMTTEAAPLDSSFISPRPTQLEVSMHELPSYEKHYNKFYHVAPSYFGTGYADPLTPYMYTQEAPLKLDTENNSLTSLSRKTNKNALSSDSPRTEGQKSTVKKELKESETKLTNGTTPGDKKDNNLSDSESNPEKKPQYSYVALIAKAIEASKDKKLQLNEIYTYVVDKFPYFKNLHDQNKTGWKNSIRHNLSLNDCFLKIPRGEGSGGGSGGKGHFWTVVQPQNEMFENGNYKRRRKTRRNAYNTSPYQLSRQRGDTVYSFYNSPFQYGCSPFNQYHPSMNYQPPALGSHTNTFTPTFPSGLHSPSEFSSAFTNSIMAVTNHSSIPQSTYPSTSFSNPRLPPSISSTEDIYNPHIGYNGSVSGLNGGESQPSPSPLYYQSYDNSGSAYGVRNEQNKLADDNSVNQISSRPPFSWSVEREKPFP